MADYQQVRKMIDIYKSQLSEEFGSFTLSDSPQPGRVVLMPNEGDRTGWHACYISAGRLMVDDYCPEAEET